ncbi:MAG: hypothetical protein ACI4I3_11045 [Acutalibacteraceae bacterium]
MKKKLTARLCFFMCLVLIISSFAACSVKKKDGDETSTTLASADSWSPGVDDVYQNVPISKAELVDLVEKVLGDEVKDFNGDLNTLTPEQIEKVEDYAKDNGLIVGKDDNGNTVIKKDEVPVTKVPQNEIDEIYSKASVKDPSNLTPEEITEISKVADDNGLIVQTKPSGGGIDIVRPVSTTKAPATTARVTAPTATTKKDNTPDKTTKPPKASTGVYVPPTAGDVASRGTTAAPVSKITSDWGLTFATGSSGSNSVFAANDVTGDGGTVAAGFTMSSETGSNPAALIVKYSDKGKILWKSIITGDETTTFEDVAVLKDGSIVAVGYTLASNIFNDSEYVCKDTVEAILVKYSSDGKTLWTKIFGGSGDDMLYAVCATNDGGFVVGGKTDSTDGHFAGLKAGASKSFIYKCDANAGIQWRDSLAGSKHCAVEDISVGSTGEVFSTISSFCNDGDFAGLKQTEEELKVRYTVVTKHSASGSRVWAKAIYDIGYVDLPAIVATDNGGCVVAGKYTSTSEGNKYSFKGIYNGGMTGTTDGMIVAFKADGSFYWKLPLIGFENDFLTGITKIPGGYAVSGYTASSNRDFAITNRGDYDAFIYTVTSVGKAKNIYTFGGSDSDNARAICSDGKSLYVCGSTNSSDGYFSEKSPSGGAESAVCFNIRYTVG